MNLVRVRQRAEAVKEEQAAKVRAEIPFTIEFKEGVRMQESQTLQRLRSWRAYLETL